MTLLHVEGLAVEIDGRPILHDVSLTLARGETLGIVGASGSGKSMTALSVMRLLPRGVAARGRIVFGGSDLMSMDEEAMCAMRGRRIGMVFQEPMSALNPLMTIGAQVAEGIALHADVSRAQAWARACAMLERVGLDNTRVPPDRFPHQLSGGQRQRVVIAMAVAMRPDLIIADEPTTALDVTTQAEILALLKDIVREEGAGLLLISHDPFVVSAMADRVAVMAEGRIVETVTASAFTHHLAPTRVAPPEVTPPSGRPLMEAQAVTRVFPQPRRHLFARRTDMRALDGVSLAIHAGESVALVGESGAGKTTLARLLLGLDTPSAGQVLFHGKPLGREAAHRRGLLRGEVQAVFQDPYDSLDPRQTAGAIVAEPLMGVSRQAARAQAEAALAEVGLRPEDAGRYPHAFSGGQRQRIALARALVTRPQLIVLDEPVSSLDPVVRDQILDLLAGVRARHGVAYLLITHDLRVAQALSQRIAVMQGGRIVETGATTDVLRNPQNPYTRRLLASVPGFSGLSGEALS